jgi:hypothetical protein
MLASEVKKGAHLGWKQMAGMMVGVEGKTLFRPALQNLHQLAARKQWTETELEGLRNPVRGGAGRQLGSKIVHHQPAGDVDLHDPAGAMKLPGERVACRGIAE